MKIGSSCLRAYVDNNAMLISTAAVSRHALSFYESYNSEVQLSRIDNLQIVEAPEYLPR